MVTAGLFVLGVVADFAGAFGVDVNQSITIRWLLAEVVISAAIILVMAQFMIQMKLKLGGPDQNAQSLIKQLQQENKELHVSLKSIVFERELLQSAFQVIEVDRVQQFTDPEVAHLSAISDSMKQCRDMLSEEDRVDIIKMIIKLSCADRDFRKEEQLAIRDMAHKYNIDANIVSLLIDKATDRLKSHKNGDTQPLLS